MWLKKNYKVQAWFHEKWNDYPTQYAFKTRAMKFACRTILKDNQALKIQVVSLNTGNVILSLWRNTETQ